MSTSKKKPTAAAAASPAAKAAGGKKKAGDGKPKVSQEVYDKLPPSVKTRCIAAIIMVKVQFGMIVTDMRGKVGGHVFSRNSSGSYVRPKTIPVSPNTIAQNVVKGLFNNVSGAWRLLNQAQRDTFITYAPDWSNLNVWGSSQPLTGQQLFMKINQQLQAFGVPMLGSCSPPGSIATPTATGATADISATEIVLAGVNATGVNQRIGVYATAPMSAGVQFIGKSKYKLIEVVPESTATGDLDVATSYEVVFGNPFSLINVGTKIGLRMVMIDTGTGQASPPADFVAVIQS